MKLKTIRNADLKDKKVFVRVDFNVPLDSHGSIQDTSRIDASLPTLEYILSQGASIILASHLGRPKGKPTPDCSLSVTARYLSNKLQKPVLFVEECIGPKAKAAAKNLAPGNILMLENLRFHKEEEANDTNFAKELASLAQIYVNDAFGAAHRRHASIEGITHYIPTKLAGFLMEKEVEYLRNHIACPEKPFLVILGGAKVSDKIGLIKNLLDKADTIFIGGAMAYTFLKALGEPVGNSKVEADSLHLALDIVEKAKEKKVNLLFPQDHIVSASFDYKTHTLGDFSCQESIPEGYLGLDIGPKTLAYLGPIIKNAKTIFWNGPMGVFEVPSLAKGTFALAKAIADSDALSIVGGGDSQAAIRQSGYQEKISFISTGGGASLEFLEGKELPGIAVLDLLYHE